MLIKGFCDCLNTDFVHRSPFTQRQQRKRKRRKIDSNVSTNKKAHPGCAFYYRCRVSSKSDITKSDIRHYLLLPLVSLSRSNNRLKRSVLDNGFWLIPLPEGMIYDTFKPNTLYLRPAPSVKYLRLPFNLSS